MNPIKPLHRVRYWTPLIDIRGELGKEAVGGGARGRSFLTLEKGNGRPGDGGNVTARLPEFLDTLKGRTPTRLSGIG